MDIQELACVIVGSGWTTPKCVGQAGSSQAELELQATGEISSYSRKPLLCSSGLVTDWRGPARLWRIISFTESQLFNQHHLQNTSTATPGLVFNEITVYKSQARLTR